MQKKYKSLRQWLISSCFLLTSFVVFAHLLTKDATEMIDIVICSGTCIDIGITTKKKHEWQPTKGLVKPKKSKTSVCPENSTAYTLIIKDKKGIVSKKIDYQIKVIQNSCDIKDYFLENKYARFDIEITEDLPPLADTTVLSNNNIKDFARKLITYEGFDKVSPKSFLAFDIENAAADGITAKAIITKNENICDKNINFSKEIKLAPSESGTHIHLWEGEECDGEQDVMFVKFF